MARRALTIFACVVGLSVPALNAAAFAHTKAARQRTVTVSKPASVLGTTVICNKANSVALWSTASAGIKNTAWGPLQIKLTYQKIGKHIKIVNVEWPIWPQHTAKSIYINQRALPLLQQEVIQLQSANLETVSGATNVSLSFKQSLLAALALAAKS